MLDICLVKVYSADHAAKILAVSRTRFPELDFEGPRSTGTSDNFEKKVAVDGPVVNAGELGSSTFSPGQALPAGPLGLGQRWTVARKREVVLRLLRDEPVQLLSRQLGVEIFRLEQWREKAIGGIDASLKQRKGDPVQAELDSAMKRIGELTMQVELLEAKTETFGPLGRRRSRR